MQCFTAMPDYVIVLTKKVITRSPCDPRTRPDGILVRLQPAEHPAGINNANESKVQRG